jgi:hypothetical protein
VKKWFCRLALTPGGGDDVDRAGREVAGVADAGAPVERRRMDAAGRDDDLASAEERHRAVLAADMGADDPPALKGVRTSVLVGCEDWAGGPRR